MKTLRQKIKTPGGDVLATTGWSDDGVFRYALGRVWDEASPAAAFVLLHPRRDDSEIVRACSRMARGWGCGGILLLALHAVVTDSPAELPTLADPVGPDNLGFCRRVLDSTNPAFTIAAWGSDQSAALVSPGFVLTVGRQMTCLGRNLDGSPVHPLQVTAGDASRVAGAVPLYEYP